MLVAVSIVPSVVTPAQLACNLSTLGTERANPIVFLVRWSKKEKKRQESA